MALTVGVVGGGVPATARVPINLRVQCEAGLVGILPEALTFPGPTVAGTWAVGTTRVTVNNLPAINTVSTGTGVNAVGAVVGPLQIVQPSARLQIT